MSRFERLEDRNPKSKTALSLIRVELARVTAAHFAGAPTYDTMCDLELQLFDMLHPVHWASHSDFQDKATPLPVFQSE